MGKMRPNQEANMYDDRPTRGREQEQERERKEMETGNKGEIWPVSGWIKVAYFLTAKKKGFFPWGKTYAK